MFDNPKRRYFHSCLNADSYDRQQFEQLLKIAPKLQKIETRGEEIFPGYVNLMGDQWSALYKTSPEFNPEADSRAAAHRPLIQKMMASEEYQKLRGQTMLDDFSSAIGTVSMSEKIIEYIEERQKQDEQAKKMLEQQKEMQKQLQQNQQAMDKRDMQGKQPTKQQEQKAQSLAEQLGQLEQQMGQQLADGMDMSQMVSQIAQDARDAKESMENLMAGTQAGSGHSEMQKIPLRQQLALAEVLKHNETVKKVAEWAGRFKAIARKKQKSKHVFSVEREGIIHGDDPELLLPTELAMLKNPATKLDFYRRFTEKETLQYAPQGKDAAGKGPIVLCLDKSGSMVRMKEQAAGFALAIAMIAKRQHRDFAYIPFDDDVGGTMTFHRGKIPVRDMLEIATEFMNGGTNFEEPLHEAIRVMEKQSRFKNADVVFVTDGCAQVSDGFIADYHAKKKKLDFKCMGCVLGSGQSEQLELEKFADEWFSATNLVEAAENSAVFEI
ncbi:protein ViaA [Peptococcaceae bacterium CEB3]|nr:protein ViaA [Peptococcaceae bacterium CEB3]